MIVLAITLKYFVRSLRDRNRLDHATQTGLDIILFSINISQYCDTRHKNLDILFGFLGKGNVGEMPDKKNLRETRITENSMGW